MERKPLSKLLYVVDKGTIVYTVTNLERRSYKRSAFVGREISNNLVEDGLTTRRQLLEAKTFAAFRGPRHETFVKSCLVVRDMLGNHYRQGRQA